MSSIEQRLQELGHALPSVTAPLASYVPAVQVGQLVISSGQLPIAAKEVMFAGKVGKDLHDEDGQHASRLCALNALAAIKSVIGDLDRIRRIVRVEGYVQSAEGFSRQPYVVNGASELLLQVFGEQGRHTRIAVGVSELPLNAAVEIAVWAEVSPT